MKCLGRLETMACAAALLFAACSGSSEGDGGNTEKPPKEEMPPVDPDSFNRNPEHPLSCDRPLSEVSSATQLQRLTHQQYANTLRDLFQGLVPDGDLPRAQDFADELKEGTFSNNVLRQLGSDAVTQAREAAVVSVSGAAVKDLPKLMGCEGEGGCVDSFIENFGLRAWRRPLTNDEKGGLKDLYGEARKSFEHKESVQVVLGAMLQSPQFLYRIQEGTGDAEKDLGKRLSDYEVASNLSYTIWNTMPDNELFEAAKKGELKTAAQVEQQATRMLESDRGREAILQFQREWLHTDRLANDLATKDTQIYPNYGASQADAILKGLDKFLEDSFWEGDHSLKRFYTSSKGFVNDASAELFGVEKPGSSDLVSVDLDSSQRQGFLTQPGFLAGRANRQNHSAILRGAFIMEQLLCAPSPPPPDDVIPEIKPVEDRESMTYRQVVQATVEVGTCKGCHEVIDGYGFLFENYDATGAYVTKERDLDIDASGQVSGTYDLDGQYQNGIEFAQKLAESEQAAQCAVQFFYEFAMARKPMAEDGCMIAPLTDNFIKNGTDMQKLLVDIVKTPAFRYRSVAQ